MRAAQSNRVNGCGHFRGRDAQGQVGVAQLLLRQPVRHRPLVQAEAADDGRARRCPLENPDGKIEAGPSGHKPRDVCGGPVFRRSIASQFQIGRRLFTLEFDSEPWMPGRELARRIRVVVEEEVLYRVLLAARCPLESAGDPWFHAGAVACLLGEPGGFVEPCVCQHLTRHDAAPYRHSPARGPLARRHRPGRGRRWHWPDRSAASPHPRPVARR